MTLNQLGYYIISGAENCGKCTYGKAYEKDNIRIHFDYDNRTVSKTKNAFWYDSFTFDEINAISKMIGDD